MHTPIHLNGFHEKIRDPRLCYMVPSGPEINPIDRADSAVRTFVDSVISRLITPHEITRANMSDDRQWTQAFQEVMVVPAPVVEPMPAGDPFGPREYLLSLSEDARKDELVRYIRATIPASVRTSNALLNATPQMARCFNAANLDTTLGADGAQMRLDLAADAPPRMTVITRALVYIMGGNALAVAGPALTFAQDTLNAVYPPDRLGHLYTDYMESIQLLRRRNPAPTAEQLRAVDYLKEQLPESRLRGWLRIMPPDDAGGARGTRSRINEVADILVKRDQEQNLLRLRTQQDIVQIDQKTQKMLENMGRTFMENFERLDAPWQWAAIAAIAYLGYKAWTTDAKFMYFIPYKTLPLLVGGVMAYQTMIAGQSPGEAMNGIGSGVQSIVNWGVDGIFGIARQFRAINPPQQEFLFRQVEMMSRFFNERTFINIYPAVVGFTAMAQVPVDKISAAFNPVPGGPGNRWTFDPDHPTFDAALQGVMKRDQMDDNLVRQSLRGPNNVHITKALAGLFYTIGARKPANRVRAAGIEKRRRDLATAANPQPSHDMIPAGPELTDYVRLVNEGLEDSRRPPYAGKNLSVLIGEFLEGNLDDRRFIDGAENVPDVNLLRPGERNLQVLRNGAAPPPVEGFRNSAAAERLEHVARLTTEYREFLDFCRRHHQIITADAEAALLPRFNGIVGDPAASLPDINLAISQLKYAILAGANSTTALPMTAATVNTLGIPPSGTVATFLSTIGGWLATFNRNILTVSRNFHRVESMQDIVNILNDRFIAVGGPTSINNRGFPRLRAEAERYRRLFETMRNDGATLGIGGARDNRRRAATAFRASLDPLMLAPPAAHGTFGSAKNADGAIFNIVDRGPYANYNAGINRMEKFYATEAANDILLALLTNHRSSGLHDPTIQLADRILTPREEGNIQRRWQQRWTLIVGDGNDPSLGYWGRVETHERVRAAEALPGAAALEAVDVKNPARAQTALDQVATISQAYLYLHHSRNLPPPLGGRFNDTELKSKILAIARSFEKCWYETNISRPPADVADPIRSDLRGRHGYTPANLAILRDTMRIMDIGNFKRHPLPFPTSPDPKPKPVLRDSIHHIVEKGT